MQKLNETHDPKLSSWIGSARDSEFPIQNLPYGVFMRPRAAASARIGVAIGDQILDLKACIERGLFAAHSQGMRAALEMPSLNGLMSLGTAQWSALRQSISELLRTGSSLSSDKALADEVLLPMLDAQLLLPAEISNYTDFYASLHHATNVGMLFRPENPLFPNYKYLPIAYHGRASSVVLSGARVIRPRGQIKASETEPPEYRPSRALDFEVELGAFIGMGNALGTTVEIDRAEDHLFGFCLLNDWSARDIQKWEYQPLGPFLAKNFATSISPWVVTLEALAPFRCPAQQRSAGDPAPLPYLNSAADRSSGGFDIELQVSLLSKEMRSKKLAPFVLGTSNSKDLYWTTAQCITQHASNGCNLLPGDLLGSGTISGMAESARGCLLEMTQAGKRSIELPSGESRKYLEDGDEVIITAKAARSGAIAIGFGSVRGEIAAANG